jgi:hypothetical protein
VAYTGKRNNISQEEKEAIQNIIMRSVHQWYSKNYLKRYFPAVSMQEAVHMVDSQELVICSDMFTYVSLAQGQTL